jgi:tRNA pseudouridine55 synthase
VEETFPTAHISEDLLHKTTEQFTGEIQQKPPIFSAIKKDGKRLYELARKGETTEIKERTVTVSKFEITKINLPEVAFRIICSKGTYIRSIAFDYGKALNSGAHLSALRRTQIGNFSADDALSVEEFIENLKGGV